MNEDKTLTLLASLHTGLHWLGIGVTLPVLTLFLREKGLDYSRIGLAFALYSGVILLFELPTGGLADRYGRKKVYLVAMVLQAAGAVTALLPFGFPGVAGAFLLLGSSRALASGTMDAYFVSRFLKTGDRDDLPRFLSITGIFAPLALGLSSLLGGWLPSHLTGGDVPSFSVNFVFFFLLTLLQIIFTGLFIREKRGPEEPLDSEDANPSLREILADSLKACAVNPVIMVILVSGLAWGFALSGLEQLWQPRLKSLLTESSDTMIFGWLTTGYFLAGSLGNGAAGLICRWSGNRYSLILFSGRMMMGLLYIILAFQSAVFPFALFYILLFFFNGIQGPPETALLNGTVPDDRRSTFYSLSSFFLHIGGMAGSILSGFLAQRYSIPAAWICASLVFMLSSLLYLTLPNRSERRGAENDEF